MLLLIVFFIACGPAHASDLAHPKDLNSVSITLERTACFGRCPVYTVSLNGSGQVVYKGDDNVDLPGEQKSQIDPGNVLMLLKSFDHIHFFSLADHYQGSCTDLPSEIISLSIDGRSKKINVYFCHDKRSGPEVDLLKLAHEIDTVTGTSGRISCDQICLTELIHNGLDVNSKDHSRDTLLMLAVRKRDLGSFRLLLNAGADVNAANDSGDTALMLAVQNNEPDMVSELLAHKAHSKAKNKAGMTALQMAGTPELKKLLGQTRAK
jgi:hypothetical protein